MVGHINCQECGSEGFEGIVGLGSHLGLNHEISSKEYYDKYFLENEEEKVCNVSDCYRSSSFHNLGEGYRVSCGDKSCSNSLSNFDEEWRENIAQATKERYQDEEEREKTRNALQEYYDNHENSMTGRTHTQETKEKMSETWQNKSKEEILEINKKIFESRDVSGKTSIEKKCAEILKGVSGDWEFVGNGDFWINVGYKCVCPDFIYSDEKIVVEVFNNYWKERSYGSVENYIEERTEVLNEGGWSAVFVNSDEGELKEHIIESKLSKFDYGR